MRRNTLALLPPYGLRLTELMMHGITRKRHPVGRISFSVMRRMIFNTLRITPHRVKDCAFPSYELRLTELSSELYIFEFFESILDLIFTISSELVAHLLS
jgi:hypothetical protein